jgi:hypothetical protein
MDGRGPVRQNPAVNPRRRTVLLAAALGLAAVHPGRAETADTWPAVPRVVAVGDLHGDYGQLVSVLESAGLVDAKRRWTGGKTHLVQTGDRVDRGPDSRKVMELLMRLEKEARKAGGMVHPLLGNHEAMNILGDLRYVAPAEFAAFQGPDSRRHRDALWEQRRTQREAGGQAPPTAEDRKRFEAEIPLGWIEHRLAFSPQGRYGAWLARQNTLLRIGDTLFVHAGLSPKYADFSLADVNEKIRRELRDADPVHALLSRDPAGPLWYRGLAEGDPALAAHVQAVLDRHGCRRLVIGHTPAEGLLVSPRYGGRVILIDVGLSRVYGGPPAALILEGGQAFALHRGKRLPLPEGEGDAALRYVRAVAALEPDPSRLAPLLERLAGAVSAVP